jgi:REP element-mobilizing transposase RayT
MVEAMARPTRNDGTNGWHHVMNRGVDHQVTFFNDSNRVVFERLAGEAALEHGVEIHAYCLMDNHFHLLAHCPDGGLSSTMQQLVSSYTRIVNSQTDRDGALFRGRFHSVPVTSERHVLHAAAYIHRNPIDLMPAAALGAYRWSSFGSYLLTRSAPPWLTTEWVAERLSIEEHRAMVMRDLAEPARLPMLEAWTAIDLAVAGTGATDGAVRTALRALLGSQLAGASAEDLAARLGLAGPGAARSALLRARHRYDRDPSFRDLAAKTQRLVSDTKRCVRG